MKAKRLSCLFLIVSILILSVAVYRMYNKKKTEDYCPYCQRMMGGRRGMGRGMGLGPYGQGCPYTQNVNLDSENVAPCGCPCPMCRMSPANCPMNM
jgi:hypothetical protein